MREAYRLNKHLIDGLEVRLVIGYVYTGPNEPADFKTVQDRIITSLRHLNSHYAHTPHETSPT